MQFPQFLQPPPLEATIRTPRIPSNLGIRKSQMSDEEKNHNIYLILLLVIAEEIFFEISSKGLWRVCSTSSSSCVNSPVPSLIYVQIYKEQEQRYLQVLHNLAGVEGHVLEVPE